MATKTKKELEAEILLVAEGVDALRKEVTTPMSIEAMQVLMDYLLSGQVTSDEHAEQIKELTGRSATISDTILISRLSLTQIMEEINDKLTRVMQEVSIQGDVLEKLGATEEMFQEAAESYNKKVEEMVAAHTAKKEEIDEA
ncbi:glycosyltransferase [Bacillus phage vB_BcgM]|nr:glycosyltransferase [Bacillus phage vB_BcgM]